MSLGPARALNSGFAHDRYTDLHIYRIMQLFQGCFSIGPGNTRMAGGSREKTKPAV
jgi:hypothetical protein